MVWARQIAFGAWGCVCRTPKAKKNGPSVLVDGMGRFKWGYNRNIRNKKPPKWEVEENRLQESGRIRQQP